MSEPSFPQKLVIPSESTESLREVANCCNRLIESADIVCQPSEPLDQRWRIGWKEIVADISHLEYLLISLS
jgi:hypothetical protein